MKVAFYCVAIALILTTSLVLGQTSADTPLKPFHLRFDKYTQSPSDGAFTFHFQFSDLPAPHVNLQGGTEPKNEFKIGDVIGHYKIVRFSQKIENPGPNDEFVKRDVSELTLENQAKPGEVISVHFLQTYDIPEAGIPLPGIEGILSRYHVGDEAAPLIKELNLTAQPSFVYPNLPVGEERKDYFLLEGNVTISTRMNDGGKIVFSSAPFFIEDRTPIPDRLKKYNNAMDDYAKKHGAK